LKDSNRKAMFASKIHKGDKGTHVEIGTMEFEGKKFTSGGSSLGRHKETGRLGGILYAYPKESKVGTWNGKEKYPAEFGNEWRGNMGDVRQQVSFTMNGKKFSGIYFKSGSDIVRVKEKK